MAVLFPLKDVVAEFASYLTYCERRGLRAVVPRARAER